MKLKNLTSSFYNHSHLLILLALPGLLLGFHQKGFFTNISGIDPWVYFGYFINLDSLLHLFPNTYYGSRLSWNLPGYFIYSLFSPVVADYVLHLGFYYVAVFSLYFTLKYTIGRHAALFASVFMGSYIYFLYPISWDYVDGAGITYFLVTTLMFTLATQISAWPFWLFLSGVGYGALVYTNLFLVTFTPLFVIYYLSLNYLNGKRPLFKSFGWFMGGVLVLTLLLGTINYSFTKEFWFYRPSIQFALNTVNKVNPYKRDLFSEAYWLILPMVTLVSSLVLLALPQKLSFFKKLSFSHVHIFLLVYFILTALMFIGWQFKGQPILQFFFYASYLIPVTFLALGTQFSLLFRNWQGPYQTVLMVSCTLVLSLTFNTLIPRIGSSFPVLGEYSRHDFMQVAISSVKTVQRVSESQKLKGAPFFWYNSKDPLGQQYASVVSTYLWGYSLINADFPALEKRWDGDNINVIFRELLSTRNLVIVLSNDQNVFQQAQQAFDKWGIKTHFLTEEHIQEGPLSFKMTFLEVLGQSLSVPQALQQALQHHQSGNLPAAEDLYRQVLQLEPNNAQALHYLGVLAAQMKRFDAAVDLMKKSLVVNPSAPLYYSNLAGALLQQGKLAEAIMCYQRALSLDPQNAETRRLFEKAKTQVPGGMASPEGVGNESPCVVK